MKPVSSETSVHCGDGAHPIFSHDNYSSTWGQQDYPVSRKYPQALQSLLTRGKLERIHSASLTWIHSADGYALLSTLHAYQIFHQRRWETTTSWGLYTMFPLMSPDEDIVWQLQPLQEHAECINNMLSACSAADPPFCSVCLCSTSRLKNLAVCSSFQN